MISVDLLNLLMLNDIWLLKAIKSRFKTVMELQHIFLKFLLITMDTYSV